MTTPFYGFVDDTGKLQWDWPTQVKAFVARFKGCEIEVEIRERRKKRSLDQNAGFHAMITPWAQDEGHDITELKRDLMGEIFGWSETVSPLSQSRVPLKPHTSKLTVAEFSELIERTLEIAARMGVILEAPNEYLERKEKAAQVA